MEKRLQSIADRAKAQSLPYVRDISDDRAGRRIMRATNAKRFAEGDSLWI